MLSRVIACLERIAPLRLAEPWDNVGLILEPYKLRTDFHHILLTIDLSTAVVDEAVKSKAGLIVSYHPPIFKPLTSLRQSNPLQAALTRCASEGIAVYSPHTALDAVNGGVNDWLLSGLLQGNRKLTSNILEEISKEQKIGGRGRLATFDQAIPFDELVLLIKHHLGLSTVQIGVPRTPDNSVNTPIRTVAICAGSGGSMLRNVDADVYWTGEMTHHEVLDAVARGRHVVLCGHTNTERGYLSQMRHTLLEMVHSDTTDDAHLNEGLDVIISQEDRHPLLYL